MCDLFSFGYCSIITDSDKGFLSADIYNEVFSVYGTIHNSQLRQYSLILYNVLILYFLIYLLNNKFQLFLYGELISEIYGHLHCLEDII